MLEIKKIRIIELLIVLYILSIYQFFYLLPIGNPLRDLSSYGRLQTLISVITFLLWLLLFKKFRVKKEFIVPVLLTLTIFILNFLYTSLKYQVSFKASFPPVISLLTLVMCFPLSSYISKNRVKFERILILIATFGNLNIIIQSVIYNLSGRVYLYLPLIGDNNSLRYLTRESTLRDYWLVPINMVLFMVILPRIIEKKAKLMDYLCLMTVIYFIFFVGQTRMINIIVVLISVSVIATKIIGNKISNWLVVIIRFLAVLIFVYLVYKGIGAAYRLFYPFLDGSYVNDGSYFARLGAWSYFLTSILNNPIFGLGLSEFQIGSYLSNVFRGPLGHFFYEDVGLIGSAARFGLPIILVYIWTCKLIFNNFVSYKDYFSLCSLFYLIFSIGTASVYNSGHIIILVFVLAFNMSPTIDKNVNSLG